MKRPALLFVLVLSAAAFVAPARAQTVSLHCTNPNLRLSYIVDVDYGANTVTSKPDIVGETARTYRARINDSLITWEEPGDAGNGRRYLTISRINGQLNACDNGGCTQRICKPAQRQF